MYWLTLYFQYSIVFFSLIFAFYFTGKLLLFTVRKFLNLAAWSLYEDIFGSLLLGCISIVTVFSLSVTHGKTVNVLFLFVGLSLLLVLGKKRQEPTAFTFLPKLKLRQGLELCLYAWGIYTLFALGVIKNSDWSTFLLFRQTDDWGFFSAVMHSLLLTGQENTYDVYNLLDSDYWGMVPYHYTEMWIAGLLRLLRPASLPIYLIGTVVYPFYLLLASVGSWAFLECWIRPSRWFHRGMVFLCFFGTGWFFLNLIRQEGLLELFTSNLTINFLLLKPRWALNYACFLSFLLLWAKQREELGILSLLAMPVVSFDSLPIVMGGMLLYAFTRLWKHPKPFGLSLRTGFAYGLFLLLCFLLYKEFGNDKLGIYHPWKILLQELALTQNAILFPPVFFLRGILQIGILYSFHLLILYYFLRHNDREYFHGALLLSSLMMLCAVGTWSAFYALFDSIQVMTSFLSIYQTLLLVLGVILLSRIRMPAKFFIAGYLIVGSICNFTIFFLPASVGKIFPPYSLDFLNAVRDLSPASKVGISIQSGKDFQSWPMRNIAFPLGSSYLPFMPRFLRTVEVGVFDIPETPFRGRPSRIPLLNLPLDFSPIDAYRSRAWKETSLFMRYFRKISLQRPDLTADAAQLALVDDYKIDWALVSKNTAVSSMLQQRVTYEIRDPISGDRFLLLKPASERRTP